MSDGSVLDVTAPSGGVTSGVGVKIGALLGIPVTSNAAGDVVAVHTTGVFDHAKTTGEAWTVGATLYWDDTNKRFTTTSSGNTKAGYAVAAALSADTVGRVRLVPTI
ncbi:MAG: DUF2190 family protein [Brevundimonas sp.]|nr:MAG: DUF2190 family protein [Brevundimonas sp.]